MKYNGLDSFFRYELNKFLPKYRLSKTALVLLIKVFQYFPGWPLTKSRIDALSNRSSYSISKIEKELGYSHKISMEEGVRTMVKQWKNA